MREGAFDYVTKPVLDDEMVRRRRTRPRVRPPAHRERGPARPPRHARRARGEPSGATPTFLKVFETVDAVAPTRATVLITGESGTGKSLVARMIHDTSDRKDKPFVELNCGALPEGLLESELFGHAKGSFTGATATRTGRFLAADGGTLFLDEIGDRHPRPCRCKLLRVIQDRSLRAGRQRGDDRGRRAPDPGDERGPRPSASRRARSGAISTTASASSRSTCRRCASAAATSRCSPCTSSAASPRRTTRPCGTSTTTR